MVLAQTLNRQQLIESNRTTEIDFQRKEKHPSFKEKH
jgi:hypothetical protein